jgi:hypothetical protein
MMVKIQYFIIVSLLGLSLNSCRQLNKENEHEKTSLMVYGFPLEINTPEDATFIKNKNGGTDNLIITNNQDFNIQVTMADAVSSSIAEIKSRERENMITNPFFIKILEDYDDGFLYEYSTPKGNAYDFRIFKIQGNKTYTFQSGITGQYSESETKQMIKSIR